MMGDSSGEQTVLEKAFAVDIAKQGRAACKKCKQKCEQGQMRLAKITPSPYGSGFMKQWHHVDCFFEASMKQRATTHRLKSPDEDLEGWETVDDEHKKILIQKINGCEKEFSAKHNLTFKAIEYVSSGKRTSNDAAGPSKAKKQKISPVKNKNVSNSSTSTFRAFRKLVADITNVSSYLEKTAHVQKLFSKKDFNGDIALWCRLLLPGVVKRIYNLQSKQLIKLFSRIFQTNQEEMLEDLEQGDVAETIFKFFEDSKSVRPSKASTVTLEDVDEFLEKLSALTVEDEQVFHLKGFAKRCTANDLKYVIRLVKHDLRMNAGAKHILEGVHPKAYESYQACRDLQQVINTCLSGSITSASVSVSVMTPVLPMLAEACKSVEQAMKKCPNGMYSEIKYDGERVQLHKQGNEFKYFSRSLKPVLPHKISHFKDYIPKAFPHGNDLILDSEILMVDTQTGKPLPFGSLGKHKKEEFKDATVCLFVFDCIYYNGEVLSQKPLKLRKKILQDNMVEIKNHIMFSEMKEIHKADDLKLMIAKVLKLGLEGLVLKDLKSIYEPGKRHWLKVKKDYLFDGAMADSADLIVLGAWYGTGKKGGMMSVFLMGCYDPYTKKFKTVTKVHTGHDDKTLERLQKELDMVKISCDYDKVPSWLDCTRTMVPDFVAKDAKNQPVWEITGAEFTQVYEVHTADGISIRFPRVSRIRDDKTWETATNLQELNVLYKESKNADVGLLLQGVKSHKLDSDDDDDEKNSDSDNSDLGHKRKLPSEDNRSEGKSDDDDPVPTKTSKFNDVKSPQERLKNNGKTSAVQLKNPLPDYFEDVNLLVQIEKAEMCKELLRHFVAYSGVIISENEYLKANYVLHASETVDDMFKIPCANTAKHIKQEWIKDSIQNKSILDWRKYAVVYSKSDD